ncbi:MAG: hypothetical protein NUW08_02115 [Candidatus Uhrbacteria bacterium]|nr:hypothetical protein [Candidatus Uhrbacteria bacterium]
MQMRLALIETKPDPSADAANTIGIEATLLALDDGAFARLTEAAWCGGNGGCSGYDDLALPERWIKCPPYGRA